MKFGKIILKKVLYILISIALVVTNTTLAFAMNASYGIDADVMPIFGVNVDESHSNNMSITFDCSYENINMNIILNILDNYDTKATFFMTGDFIKNNVELVKEVIRRGHEIGNHTTRHLNFNHQSELTIQNEILSCHNIFKNYFGYDLNLFRFPYGKYTISSIAMLKSMNYYPIQWTADSLDWENKGVDAILTNLIIQDAYKPGGILLFHLNAIFTPHALPQVLEHIKNAGLKCVKVSDLIYKDNFYLDYIGMQTKK